MQVPAQTLPAGDALWPSAPEQPLQVNLLGILGLAGISCSCLFLTLKVKEYVETSRLFASMPLEIPLTWLATGGSAFVVTYVTAELSGIPLDILAVINLVALIAQQLFRLLLAGLYSMRERPEPEPDTPFTLPGRRELETAFREIVNELRAPIYQTFGVRRLASVILEGPPGAGKNYAVREFAKYLNRPVFEFWRGDSAEKITQAMQQAPSIVIIKEDAWLEETTDKTIALMRQVEHNYQKYQMIAFFLTSQSSSIATSASRRGWLGRVIHVDLPSEEEVKELLPHLFSQSPYDRAIDFSLVATRLKGPTMAKLIAFQQEAGRKAAIAGKEQIDQECIEYALAEMQVPPFTLPGRRVVETAFREIINELQNPAIYQTFGVRRPASVILEGPPGAGKNYAVREFAKYLNRPVF